MRLTDNGVAASLAAAWGREVTVSPRAALAVLSLATAAVAAEVHAAPVLRLVWLDPTDIAAGSELVARAEAEALLALSLIHI